MVETAETKKQITRIIRFRYFIFVFLVSWAGMTAWGQDQTLSQLWFTASLEHPRTEKLLLALDLQSRVSTCGGDYYRYLEATALVEHHPNQWLDLIGELTVGFTKQIDDLNFFAITPRIGVRFHLLSRVKKKLKEGKMPLPRIILAFLFRLEYRNFSYSADRPADHRLRLRARGELKLPINHKSLNIDRTLYLKSDVEYYMPIGDDIAERFASIVRYSLGIGYRFSHKWWVELLYVWDHSRDTLEDEFTVDLNIIEFILKMRF